MDSLPVNERGNTIKSIPFEGLCILPGTHLGSKFLQAFYQWQNEVEQYQSNFSDSMLYTVNPYRLKPQ